MSYFEVEIKTKINSIFFSLRSSHQFHLESLFKRRQTKTSDKFHGTTFFMELLDDRAAKSGFTVMPPPSPNPRLAHFCIRMFYESPGHRFVGWIPKWRTEWGMPHVYQSVGKMEKCKLLVATISTIGSLILMPESIRIVLNIYVILGIFFLHNYLFQRRSINSINTNFVVNYKTV